jgi:hypothetical protein
MEATKPRPVEGLAVIGAGILDAVIGVDDQMGGRLPMQHGHGQGV